MYDFSSQFFWYKLLFMAELILSECLFAARIERRNNFALRMVLSCAALLAVAFAIPVPDYNVVVISGVFFTLFACTLLAMVACLRTNFRNILFCAVAGYTLRHFAYVVFITLNDLTFYALGILTGISAGFDPYGAPLLDILSSQSILSAILYLFSYFLVFWIGQHIYAERIHPNDSMLAHTSFIAIAAIMLCPACWRCSSCSAIFFSRKRGKSSPPPSSCCMRRRSNTSWQKRTSTSSTSSATT